MKSRYLGIDYGAKRIGLAISDPEGKIAFPKEIIENSARAADYIADVCTQEGVTAVVMGESRTLQGEANPILSDIEKMKKALEEKTGLPVHLEPEHFTTTEARRSHEKKVPVDSSAAALILQSFLEKQH